MQYLYQKSFFWLSFSIKWKPLSPTLSNALRRRLLSRLGRVDYLFRDRLSLSSERDICPLPSLPTPLLRGLAVIKTTN